jgi:PTH1 family peptidyl-tRNA hydrolase
MKIVACLGNPGRKYAQNRHNVGARIGKLLAKAYALSITRKGFSSRWGKGIIHDEIELPFGDFRVKFSGGHKGHNGLRSIIQHLNTADFYRIRIGIGRPLPDIPVADYVLSNFSKEEVNCLSTIYPEIEKKIISILHGLY